LGNITTKYRETNNSLKETYTVLTINQEQIQTISARGANRKCILKLREYVKKNQAIYKLYSEDIAIAKQIIFLTQLAYAWRFWQK
jgi:Cu(I)/Ag(I) efflux system membrane fusion protein